MSNNFKSYNLDNKENFIIYLRGLIIMTHKHISVYKRYVDELDKYIKENEYDKIKTACIDPFIYFEYKDKMDGVLAYLLNLIGDETKTAMSYRKFRNFAKKRQSKGLELDLTELSEEIKFILNEFNNLRNWSLHVPESLFTAQFEIAKKYGLEKNSMNTSSTIIIPEFSTYEAEWLVDLLKEHKNIYSGSRKVFQQMKKDYSLLVGESMRIEKKHHNVRPVKDMDIPRISYEIQRGKYKGIVDNIWMPK